MSTLNPGLRYTHSPEIHDLKDPGKIVPILVQLFQPESVIDVGCGLGNFLSVFRDYGVKDILGIDGNWVQLDKLYIDPVYFRSCDLESGFSIGRRFDMALCLEVAEHISEASADLFIESLVQISDCIIFSAAVPNQGGDHHLNEQPFSYWEKKFAQHGFVFHDIFRNFFWNDCNVKWWYKQNMFLVTRNSYELPVNMNGLIPTKSLNTYIHPELLDFHASRYRFMAEKMRKLQEGRFSIRYYLNLLARAIYRRFVSK